MYPTSTLNNTQLSLICQQQQKLILQRSKRLFLCDQASLHQHQVMALNTSCSKAIVDMLGTHVPKCAIDVSNTPRFSLSQNDKKGCNLGFPKLVQNKGLFPLHAVPSKTMVLFFFFLLSLHCFNCLNDRYILV